MRPETKPDKPVARRVQLGEHDMIAVDGCRNGLIPLGTHYFDTAELDAVIEALVAMRERLR